MAHHLVPVLGLGTLAHQALLAALISTQHLTHLVRHHLVVLVSVDCHHRSGLVIPVYLELGHSRLLNQDVSGQLSQIRYRWRVFIEFSIFIVVVDVVAYSEELVVVVRASEQNRSHSYDVLLRQLAGIGRLALNLVFKSMLVLRK